MDSVTRRHEPARPELKPGQIVTWQEVGDNKPRPFRPRQGQGSLFPHNRSRDRQRSLLRRRRLAASGPLPPMLACRFTVGQLSTLRIVGDEIRERGRCTLYVDEIAGRAGVSRRHAQGALREAERLGMVRITERRVSAFRNDSNIVTVISAEWLTWLGRLGAKNFQARTSFLNSYADRRAERPQQGQGAALSSAAKGPGGVEIARSVPRSP